jgi:hypothetical protein
MRVRVSGGEKLFVGASSIRRKVLREGVPPMLRHVRRTCPTELPTGVETPDVRARDVSGGFDVSVTWASVRYPVGTQPSAALRACVVDGLRAGDRDRRLSRIEVSA